MRERVRAPELMNVQELFPMSFACLLQNGRCRERSHESPGERFGPVVEAFQRDGVIFAQRGLKLIDQSGPLFDQNDFVAAEQPQRGGRFVLGMKRRPGMAVATQGIGQSPGIMPIGFRATWYLALAI